MPTIVNENGYRIVIYVDDHEPAHVHVQARGCEAIVFLQCLGEAPTLRANYGFKDPELRAIFDLVKQNQQALCEEWRIIHVQP